jgi:hypothetical protein
LQSKLVARGNLRSWSKELLAELDADHGVFCRYHGISKRYVRLSGYAADNARKRVLFSLTVLVPRGEVTKFALKLVSALMGLLEPASDGI